MSFRVNIDQAINFIQFIRGLTGNSRGPLSGQNQQAIDSVTTRVQYTCEEIARRSLQEKHSEGPKLSDDWIEKKDHSWVLGKVEPPPYASSAKDLNTWAGEFDFYLTSWQERAQRTGRNRIFVGYNNPASRHKVSGAPIMMLAALVHNGFTDKTGHATLPPRPFLNSHWALAWYRSETRRIVTEAMISMLRTGVP